MSAKLEKQVSLPSGSSTIQHQATTQQNKLLLETTTELLDTTSINKNNNNNNIFNNNTNNSNNNNINTNSISNNNISTESKDEVDFVRTKTDSSQILMNSTSAMQQQQQQQKDIINNNNQKSSSIMKKLTTSNMSNLYNDCEVKSSLKSSLSTLEKFSFFTLSRKNNHHNQSNQQQQQQQQTQQQDQQQSINNNNNLNNINLNNKQIASLNTGDNTGSKISNSSGGKHSTFKKSHSDQQMMTTSTKQYKFVKSASLARLLGHTYNTKKIENELLKYKNNVINSSNNNNNNNNNEMKTTITSSTTGNNINNTTVQNDKSKLNQKNILANFSTNNGNFNNNNNRSIERFQMCSNIENDYVTTTTTTTSINNNNNNSNNSNNNYNNITSASYSNQYNIGNNNNNNNNTKIKTNNINEMNHTNQNSINNLNNIKCNCISQNQNCNNLNQFKSHICNHNSNINTQISNNNTNNTNNNCNKEEVNIQDFQEDHYNDISAKAFRTISRSLGKLWWKRTHSVEISAPDPEYKVSYLGNVLTGWAKGEGCVEKPLNTLWRNYTQNHKPDVIMRVRVCASGLKATTRQHGLTEYWANRITHCCSPKNYSRVFCWIYRHEGRKLKHELRCHAILCSKESIAQEICNTLRENLDRALHDFKREKILKQNARLSLANSVYENPSLPRRKILLSVGGNNYRPPMERSKSAPKLMAIEEAIGEEEGEDIEQTNEPEMPSCCQKDSLYPAMTLGRRRCRRGHSIRRTGKAYKISICDNQIIPTTTTISNECPNYESDKIKDLLDNENVCCNSISDNSMSYKTETNRNANEKIMDEEDDNGTKRKSTTSLGSSDDDDLDKLLSHNNYDTSSPLAGELLSYFDMKLHSKTSSLTDLSDSMLNNGDNCLIDRNCIQDGSCDDQILYEASLTTDPSPRPRAAISLENLDNCSDGCEGDCGAHIDFDDEEDELYYRQTAILNLLHRNSMRKLANLSMSSDDSGDSIGKSNRPVDNDLKHQINRDSDQGSISSGCETASTVTANCEDSSLKYINDDNKQQLLVSDELSVPVNLSFFNMDDQSEIKSFFDRNDDGTETKISNTTLTLKRANHHNSLTYFGDEKNHNIHKRGNHNDESSNQHSNHHQYTTRNNSSSKNNGNIDVSDSEFSDESGYVEFQDQFVPRKKSQNLHHLSSSTSTSSSSSVKTTIQQYNNNHNNKNNYNNNNS